MDRRRNWSVFVWLFVVSFCFSIAHGLRPEGGAIYALDMGGVISANTMWRLADSPINVKFSVVVNNGVTLTIEPGVVVQFNPDTFDQACG